MQNEIEHVAEPHSVADGNTVFAETPSQDHKERVTRFTQVSDPCDETIVDTYKCFCISYKAPSMFREHSDPKNTFCVHPETIREVLRIRASGGSAIYAAHRVCATGVITEYVSDNDFGEATRDWYSELVKDTSVAPVEIPN